MLKLSKTSPNCTHWESFFVLRLSKINNTFLKMHYCTFPPLNSSRLLLQNAQKRSLCSESESLLSPGHLHFALSPLSKITNWQGSQQQQKKVSKKATARRVTSLACLAGNFCSALQKAILLCYTGGSLSIKRKSSPSFLKTTPCVVVFYTRESSFQLSFLAALLSPANISCCLLQSVALPRLGAYEAISPEIHQSPCFCSSFNVTLACFQYNTPDYTLHQQCTKTCLDNNNYS